MSATDDVLEELEERYQLYLGIPRHLIPWFPTIDADKCVGCKECITFCHDTVYAYDEETKKVYVENPWHCQVYCQSCTYACNKDAITFQERREVKATIRELRKKYPPA
ncbi:MAG TPA: 4Fe-4S dicluster domain-containing protein [Anaerolineae bacterium]|nr:4Fe-4S dicluster domain-containing protein [Anaerolineae bacterium]